MTAVTSGAGVVLTPSIAGYVTAGGQSKRFGQDKALIMLGGEVMLARLCRVVSEATGSATIVAGRERPYADFGAPVIEDLWPELRHALFDPRISRVSCCSCVCKPGASDRAPVAAWTGTAVRLLAHLCGGGDTNRVRARPAQSQRRFETIANGSA
jgi:hypothetical protein